MVELLVAMGLVVVVGSIGFIFAKQSAQDSTVNINTANATNLLQDLQKTIQRDMRYYSSTDSGGQPTPPVISPDGHTITFTRFLPGASSSNDTYQVTYSTQCWTGNTYLASLNQQLRYLYGDAKVGAISTCLQDMQHTCTDGVPYITIQSTGPTYAASVFPAMPLAPPAKTPNVIAMAGCFSLDANELRITLQSGYVKYFSSEFNTAMKGGDTAQIIVAATRALGVIGKDQVFDASPQAINILPQ